MKKRRSDFYISLSNDFIAEILQDSVIEKFLLTKFMTRESIYLPLEAKEYINLFQKWLKLLLRHSKKDRFVYRYERIPHLPNHLSQFQVIAYCPPAVCHLSSLQKEKYQGIEFEMDLGSRNIQNKVNKINLDPTQLAQETYVKSFRNKIFQIKDFNILGQLDSLIMGKNRFDKACIPSIYIFTQL
jgi:hypothetical protein